MGGRDEVMEMGESDSCKECERRRKVNRCVSVNEGCVWGRLFGVEERRVKGCGRKIMLRGGRKLKNCIWRRYVAMEEERMERGGDHRVKKEKKKRGLGKGKVSEGLGGV